MEIFFWVRLLMEYFAQDKISVVLNAFTLASYILWDKIWTVDKFSVESRFPNFFFLSAGRYATWAEEHLFKSPVQLLFHRSRHMFWVF